MNLVGQENPIKIGRYINVRQRRFENVFLNKKVEVFPFTIPIDNINEVKKIEVKKIELYYW